MRIELPELLPTQPDVMTWQRRHRLRKRVHRDVALLARQAGIPREPYPFARIVCTRISNSPPDSDNLPYSFKAIRDGLVRCGVLAGDDDAHLEAVYRWQKTTHPSAGGRMLVEIDPGGFGTP